MKIRTIMGKGLRAGGILLMALVVLGSTNIMTAHAQGIYIPEESQDEAIAREAAQEAQEIKDILNGTSGVKDTEGSTADNADTVSENSKSSGVETEAVQSLTPYAKLLQGMADGTVDTNSILLEKNIMLLSGEATPHTLNNTDGDIVLMKDGAFKVTNDVPTEVNSGTVSDQLFTIIGGTNKYNITVESGARPVITLNDLQSDLTGANGKASLHIKSGAVVTLNLADTVTGTSLKGSQYMPGIILEDGATLQIQGTGSMYIYGGGGAYAVGSGSGTASGGALWIGADAKVQAYSNMQEGALNVKVSATATQNRILQGSLGTAQSTDIIVRAENRDKREEKYTMNLPSGYLSFATTTTVAGGDYVSYIAAADNAEVTDSILLADALKKDRHSYNLTGAGNTFASLTNLVSQKITYMVTFDANGGTFLGNGQSKIIQSNVGYGTTINVPEEPRRNNHDFVEWHKTKDSFASGDSWKFAVDKIVKDGTLLYASWKPIDSTVKFYSVNNSLVKTVTGKTFGDTIGEDEKPSITQKGFILVNWLAEDGSEWIFGDSGNTITKETTLLKANWLAECKVTFNANAGSDSSVTNMPDPNPIIVAATTKISGINTPQRDNYTFISWYTDAKCTKIWNLNEDTVKTNMTLYAGWGANETKVTYHINADAGESVDPTFSVVLFGDRIDEPDAKKDPRTTLPTEYVVEGWYTDARLTNKWNFSEGLKDFDGKFDLYAKWHQKTCWVTFEPNNIEASPQENKTLSVDYEANLQSSYTDLEDMLSTMFTRKGYEVKTWATSAGKAWDMSASLTGDIVLKAQWTPEVYTINFEAPEEEGSPQLPAGETAKQITYGKTLTRPKYPSAEQTWPGHTFQGWYTEKDGAGTKWRFSDEPGADKIEEPITLYAYWTLDDYTISFQTYQGDLDPIPSVTEIHYGDLIPMPVQPVRDRYEFLGWETEDGKLWDFDTDTVKGDMILYAKWQGEPVDVLLNVKYEPENEEPGKVVQVELTGIRYGDFLTKDQVQADTIEATKARPGYTLNGWYTGDSYQDEQVWDFAQNKVQPEKSEPLMLYAYWTWDEYTVQFVTYNGDSSIPSQSGLRYGNLVNRPAPDPVRAHYTFGSWYDSADKFDETTAWDFAKSKITGDMSLYASWIPDVYTLSFETNGGSNLEPVQVTYGTYVPGENLKSVKEGYVLSGWYRDAELTRPFVPASEYVDQNMTIYAKWELKKYTVRYHFRASEDSNEEEVVTFKEVYKVGDYLTKPNKTVPHKTLNGWFQDEGYQDKWVFKRDQVKNDTDLYAYWSDTQYTVHFETYGGTEIKDTQMIWGEQPEKPADPVRTGYSFTGWFKDETTKEPWNFEEDFVNGDTTIYSGWNANLYTVAFNADGGSPNGESQTLAFGSLITEPQAPAKEGYTFDGWADEKGNIWDFGKNTVADNMTLTAKWSEPVKTENNTGKNTTTSSGTSSGGDTKTGANSSGTQSTGTTAADTAAKALTDAANTLKEVLTGDKASLTYSIAGILIAAVGIIGALYKKFK
jgi:uncharacterized repeat protein (TIGR02543 family)